jgi:2-phosphosulfolactate phosphatase
MEEKRGIKMKIDCALNPSEIDWLPSRDLGGVTAVVFDVLRATSSMVTALAHGAREIYPVTSIEEALELKKRLPDAVLGGERQGDRIEGFDVGNSPLEYRALVGRRIITTTTNGTVALRAVAGAERVFAAALLNLDATARAIAALEPRELLLVCAGTFREPGLEDIFAAGLLAARFPGAQLTDAARTAAGVAAACGGDALKCLHDARNGRALLAKGRRAEVEWCAQISPCDVVAVMRDGVLMDARHA